MLKLTETCHNLLDFCSKALLDTEEQRGRMLAEHDQALNDLKYDLMYAKISKQEARVRLNMIKQSVRVKHDIVD